MIPAAAACSSKLIDALVHKVHRHLGMDFSGTRRADLLRRLRSLTQEPCENWLEELAFAEWDAAVVQSLVPAFSVGETYFQRDASAFDWLAAEQLTPLLRQRRQEGHRRLRLWSAACCTGEEAYGLLFLVDGLLGAERSSWQVNLLATDINDGFLSRARAGVYGRNSFRGDDQGFRDHYFEGRGNGWQVKAPWRERICFERFNLITEAREASIQGVDVILCRNVLMYFSPAQARSALRRLLDSLAPEGVLLVSSVEAGIATDAGLSGTHAGSNYALRPSSAGVKRHFIPPPTALVEARRPRVRPIKRPVVIKHSPSITGQPSASDGPRSPVRPQAAVDLLGDELEASILGSGLDTVQRHQACLRLARHRADRNDLKQARKWLDCALELDSRAPAAYWLLALLEDQIGRVEAALQALRKVLYLDQDFIIAYFLRARLLKAKGQPRASAKALQACRRLLQSLPEEAEVEHADGLSSGRLLELCDNLERREAMCRTA